MRETKSAWIVSPAIDLIFCCGGLLWTLVFIQNFLIEPLGNSLLTHVTEILTVIGSHAFGEAHVSATLFRIYGSAESRSKHKFLAIWLPLLGIIAINAGLMIPGITAIFLKIYLLWIAQHFTAQTYGLVLLYCYKRNYKPDSADKFLLSSLLNLTAATAVLRQLCFQDWSSDSLLNTSLPLWTVFPEWTFQTCLPGLQLVTVIFCLKIIYNSVFQKRLMPLPAMLMLLSTVFLFAADLTASAKIWIYAPAFYHATQYLVIATAKTRNDQNWQDELSKENRASLICKQGLDHYAKLILVAVAVYVGLPAMLQVLGFSYEQSFANIFCVLSFHHFIADMSIWKLKDPILRKTLLA